MYAEKTVPKIWTDFGRHARRYAVTSNCIQLRGQSTVPPTPTVIPSSSRQRLGNCCFKLSDCGEQEPPWDPLPVSVKTLLSQLLGKQGPKGAGSISSKKKKMTRFSRGRMPHLVALRHCMVGRAHKLRAQIRSTSGKSMLHTGFVRVV